MDGYNPFFNMDPAMMQRLMGGGGGVPGAMPNQAAAGAAMPGAGAMGQQMMGQQQMDPTKMQQLGKLLSALGQFQQPPKNAGAQASMPPQQMPQQQMGMMGGGPRQQMPMRPIAQVPPADLYRRLMPSLSPFGG